MNTLLILLALSCFCVFSTSFIFGPKRPPRQKRDCIWMAWKSFGMCEHDDTINVYRMERKREQIPARYGGKNCVGPDTNYKACSPAVFTGSRFLITVLGQQRRGGSAKRVLNTKPGSPANKRLNPCTKPHTDPAGNIRMLGKPCETQKRRRRSADGYIEVYEEPLRENIRVKRQTTLSTKHRDILFLIDESGSVGPTDFKKEVRLAKAIVSTLCGAISIGKSTTRIGIMGFDLKQHPMLNFDALFDRADIISHMDSKVNYTASTDGRTCLYDAFEFTRTSIFNKTNGKMGSRMGKEGIEQVIVLFTDGCANCKQQGDLPTILKNMRIKFEDKKIPIVTFFIGSLTSRCKTIMEGLADGAHCYQVFRALNWGELDEMSAAIEAQECMDSWQIGQSCPTE